MNWLLLILLGVIWGASFMGVELALQGYGPLTVAAGRILFAAILLTGIAFARGDGLPRTRGADAGRLWLHCLGFAVFTNALPFALLSWGQLNVTSGFAGITMATVPLFLLPMAWAILNEPMGLRKISGFLLGFVGVVILVGIDAIGGLGSGIENLARLACVGAALCYAIGSMITRTAPKVAMISYASAGLLLGAMMIVPTALWVEGWPRFQGWVPVGGIVFLGLFPTALATVLLVRVINAAGPTFLSLVNYQVPIWAVINGMIFLGEALPGSFLTALTLILLGLALSQSRGFRLRP